ncbi:amidase [Salipiger sp. 1_MG-2023]|uniref:amidase n=1 Tax=Salipiger sp. 1_MG-2023 TaxID=3062665 RepID=UPI0026E2A8D2|nr:amidase [Salipiger sp. 1_MG-2023]MDO6585082.1 amidase [Salipiger sp. 1_MG-2023]
MLIDHDPYHCYMPYPAVPVASAPDGPLAGLTLGVKDIYDVAGYRTGCGCPLKLAMSDIKTTTAPAIQALLDAGAAFNGKLHTDELAWSMYGMNAHFGMPVNPNAPGRIPGGSSSGSGAACAGGLADITVGSDTGGSVRAPAAFCGTWGIRPTHGLISLEGVMPLAPSYDTCGLFARDGATLLRAMSVLLADTAPLPDAPKLLKSREMFAHLGEAQRAATLAAFDVEAREVDLYPEGMDAAYETFLTSMGGDAKRHIVPFIRQSGMPLVRGIDGRAAGAEALSDAAIAEAELKRAAFAEHVTGVMDGGVLIAPVVHDVAFFPDAPTEVFDGFRHVSQRMLCVAGLAGLPQVVWPAGTLDGAPWGVSLIGPRGSDLSLIKLALTLQKDAA